MYTICLKINLNSETFGPMSLIKVIQMSLNYFHNGFFKSIMI